MHMSRVVETAGARGNHVLCILPIVLLIVVAYAVH